MHYYIAPSIGGLVFIHKLTFLNTGTKLYRVWHTLIQFVTLVQDDDIPLHSTLYTHQPQALFVSTHSLHL